MDLRVEKTQRAIRSAFFELRAKLPVEQIRVNELCRRAYINKSTFYAYYRDIYDLSESMEMETVKSIVKNIPNLRDYLSNPVELSYNLSLAFLSQQNITNVLFSGDEANRLAFRIEEAIKEMLEEYNPGFKKDIKKNLILGYCIHGSYNVIMNHPDQPPQVLLETITEITKYIAPLYQNEK